MKTTWHAVAVLLLTWSCLWAHATDPLPRLRLQLTVNGTPVSDYRITVPSGRRVRIGAELAGGLRDACMRPERYLSIPDSAQFTDRSPHGVTIKVHNAEDEGEQIYENRWEHVSDLFAWDGGDFGEEAFTIVPGPSEPGDAVKVRCAASTTWKFVQAGVGPLARLGASETIAKNRPGGTPVHATVTLVGGEKDVGDPELRLKHWGVHILQWLDKNKRELRGLSHSELNGFWPRLSIARGFGEKVIEGLTAGFWQTDGKGLAYTLTYDAPPSQLPDNPYVHATKRALTEDELGKLPPVSSANTGDDLDQRGIVTYETRLADLVLVSEGGLSPEDVFKMSLQATGGDYPMAMLTAHNVLKEVTYANRQHLALAVWDEGMKSHTPVRLFMSKLQNFRPPDDPHYADKMGPWYHPFGLLLVASCMSGTEAQLASFVENSLRAIGLGSSEDSFKQKVNEWAAGLGSRINEAVE